MTSIKVYEIRGDVKLKGTRWIMTPSDQWTRVGVVLFDLYEGEKRMYDKYSL